MASILAIILILVISVLVMRLATLPPSQWEKEWAEQEAARMAETMRKRHES